VFTPTADAPAARAGQTSGQFESGKDGDMSVTIQARQRGFSLIEFMMAVAVVAIVVGSAVPSFREVMAAMRMQVAKDALLGSLLRARSTAMLRRHPIDLCPSSDARTCNAGLEWQSGWIMFEDRDHDDTPNDLGDILFVAGPTADVAMLATEGRQTLTFQPDGSSGGSNVSITLCDRRGPSRARSVVVSNVGRARFGAPTDLQAAAACAPWSTKH
jgi:type IV fimbrial biogenesis protein FimT